MQGHSVLFLLLLKSFIFTLIILHFSIHLWLPASIAFCFYKESHQLALKVKNTDSQNIGTHLVSWSLVYIYIIYYIYLYLHNYSILHFHSIKLKYIYVLHIYIHIHIFYINVVLYKYI